MDFRWKMSTLFQTTHMTVPIISIFWVQHVPRNQQCATSFFHHLHTALTLSSYFFERIKHNLCSFINFNTAPSEKHSCISLDNYHFVMGTDLEQSQQVQKCATNLLICYKMIQSCIYKFLGGIWGILNTPYTFTLNNTMSSVLDKDHAGLVINTCSSMDYIEGYYGI